MYIYTMYTHTLAQYPHARTHIVCIYVYIYVYTNARVCVCIYVIIYIRT